MTDEQDDPLIEAALNGGPSPARSPEERDEFNRLRAGFLAFSSGVDPAPPPPAAKALLMARIGAEKKSPFLPRLALAASVFLAFGAASLFLKPEPSVRVAALSGEISSNGRPLALGDRLPTGAVVETAPGAWALLRLDRRAAVRLKDGGRLTLTRLKGEVELRLERGSLFSHVRHGTPFSVLTPAVAASVRGTTFYVQVDSPDKTYLCLCEGRLRVTAPGLLRDLETQHHEALRVTRDGAAATAAAAGMEGHTAEEGASLSLE